MATPEEIETERGRERYRGCVCACVLITDPDRVRAAGGDPDDPNSVVFNHPWDCPIARITWSPYN